MQTSRGKRFKRIGISEGVLMTHKLGPIVLSIFILVILAGCGAGLYGVFVECMWWGDCGQCKMHDSKTGECVSGKYCSDYDSENETCRVEWK